MYELKTYRGVMCHGNEKGFKIWTGIDLSVENWHEEFEEFWLKRSKVSKNLHFNGLLLAKVYDVWAKKSTEELCLIALKIGTKVEGKLTCAF